jgi:RecB family exonuclease
MRKLSVSSMGTYEKCPRKYYYQYIDKPDIERPEWAHFEFGTAAHRVLELFHEYLMNNVVPPEKWPGLMRACFKKSLAESEKRGKLDILKSDPELLPQLRKIIQEYLDIMKADGLPPVLHNELEFDFKVGGFAVRGFMDRIDRHAPGVYEVVDYKTNKNPSYLTDFQLALYALALHETYDDIKEISGSYVLLKHGSKRKAWDFTPQILEDTRNKVIQLGTDINTEKLWIKKPTFLCNWCDFKSICQESWTEDTW